MSIVATHQYTDRYAQPQLTKIKNREQLTSGSRLKTRTPKIEEQRVTILVFSINLRKIREQKVRKRYNIKISDGFGALKKLNDREDINREWENNKETIKTSPKDSLGLYELKQHKPRFDEECSRFLHKIMQAIMQWLLDPNQGNVDNVNNVSRVACGHFRNKQKQYLKAKVDELETNSKIKNMSDLYRGNNDFKKGYQPGASTMKAEKGDLVTDSHSILAILGGGARAMNSTQALVVASK